MAAGVVIAGIAALAQEIPTRTLSMKREVTVQLPRTSVLSVLGPIKCDARGNVYVRLEMAADSPVQPSLPVPITRLGPDGARKAQFDLARVPGWELSDLYDFFVGSQGEMYLLAARMVGKEKEVAVLSFREDGQYSSTIRFDTDSAIEHVAPFPTGEFLVFGWKRYLTPAGPAQAEPAAGEKEPEPMAEPFIGIFNRAGRQLLEVAFNSAEQKGEGGKQAGGDRRSLPRSAISLASVFLGSDDQVYVMARHEPREVAVISAAGTVLRRFEVASPAKDLEILEMTAGAPGQLVFQMAPKAGEGRYRMLEAQYLVVDAESGTIRERLELSPGLGIFACASAEGFVFLGTTADGKTVLRQATPQ
jgi:hypothetical protein